MTISIDKIPSLTPKQFEWVVENLNIRREEHQRLFRILVEQEPVAVLAEEAGITTQAVYLQMRRALEEMERRLKSENKLIVLAFVEPQAVKQIRELEGL